MANLQIELEKVAEIRSILGDADPELIHDTLEGQTDIFEVMDWLLAKEGDEAALAEAVANRITMLQERKKACEGRVTRLRAALSVCMAATGEKSLRRAEATVTLGWKKPAIAQIDEALLPEEYFITLHSVSRSAINEALKLGKVVPGVLLDNGGSVLTVRRK